MEALINIRKAGAVDSVLDSVKPIFDLTIFKQDYHDNRNIANVREDEREEVTRTEYILSAQTANGEAYLLKSDDENKIKNEYCEIVEAIKRGDRLYTVNE